MRTAKFQQVTENAIFLFEPRFFTTSVMTYDPRLANQTLVSSWGGTFVELDDEREAAVEERAPNAPAYPELAIVD